MTTRPVRIVQLDSGCEYLLPLAQKKIARLWDGLASGGPMKQVTAGSNGEIVEVSVVGNVGRIRISGSAPWGWVNAPIGGVPFIDQAIIVSHKPDATTGLEILKAVMRLPKTAALNDDITIGGEPWFGGGVAGRNATQQVIYVEGGNDDVDGMVIWNGLIDAGGYIILRGLELVSRKGQIKLSKDGRRALIDLQDSFTFVLDADLSQTGDDGRIVPSFTLRQLMNGDVLDGGGFFSNPVTVHGYTRDQSTILWMSGVMSALDLYPPLGTFSVNVQTWKCYMQNIDTGALTLNTTLTGAMPANSIGFFQFFSDEQGGTWSYGSYNTYEKRTDLPPPERPFDPPIDYNAHIASGMRIYHNGVQLVFLEQSFTVVDHTTPDSSGFLLAGSTNQYASISEDGRTFAVAYLDPTLPGPQQTHMYLTRDGSSTTLSFPAAAFGVQGWNTPLVFGNQVYFEPADGSNGVLCTFNGGWSSQVVVIQAATVQNTGPLEVYFQMLAETALAARIIARREAAGEDNPAGDLLLWYGRAEDSSMRFHKIARTEAGTLVHTTDGALRKPTVGGIQCDFIESTETALLWSIFT